MNKPLIACLSFLGLVGSAGAGLAMFGIDMPPWPPKDEMREVQFAQQRIAGDVLEIWEQRLIDLEIKAQRYIDNGEAVPEWLLREIKNMRNKINKRRKELGLA